MDRFYRQNKEEHEAVVRRLKRRIYHIGTLRLVLIIGMLVALWVLRHHDWELLVAIGCFCLFCFLLLVVYHTRLYDKRSYEEGIIRLCENELKALEGDYSAFDGAPEHIDAQHAFSMDLDLFGDRSLFQMVNRTVTRMGKETLVERFTHPLSCKNEILKHQEGVKEMAGLSGFRFDFYVTGETASNDQQGLDSLSSTDNGRLLSENRLVHILLWFVPATWVLLVAGVIAQLIPVSVLVVYFALSYLLANIPLRLVKKVFTSVSKTEKILKTYAKLMEMVERECFDSSLLGSFQAMLMGCADCKSANSRRTDYKSARTMDADCKSANSRRTDCKSARTMDAD